MTSPARAFPPPTPQRVVPPAEGVDLVGAEPAAAAFPTALGVATDAGARRHGSSTSPSH
jgi:GTP cyclohydrolase IA